jgi:hypothetical protein
MPAKDAMAESGGFSAGERAAMKERAAELRAEGKKGARKVRPGKRRRITMRCAVGQCTACSVRAAPFTPVPQLLGQGSDQAWAWIVTAALPGRNAVDTRWKAEPRIAVAAMGEGLRVMHEALPVRACPFWWTAADRLAEIRVRAGEGRIDPASWDEAHQPLGISRALALLADIPAADQAVVGVPPDTERTKYYRRDGDAALKLTRKPRRWARQQATLVAWTRRAVGTKPLSCRTCR